MMSQEFAIVGFLKSARRGSSVLWWSSILMLIGMVTCFALPSIDHRLIAGISVWDKPAKFFLSLIVQGITVAWVISLLEDNKRGVKTATRIFVFASWAEMVYILIQASRGEASHFNTSTMLTAILYSIMGLGAVSLVVTSAFVGWRIWENRGARLMHEAAGLGLMLSSLLGLIAGAYLSGHTSHWIGGDLTDSTGLPFFHWSMTGGDLRVAHFIGLHTAQVVPLAGLSGTKFLVYASAMIMALAMIGTFLLAIGGVPLFRA
jgi:hypothetical protein